MKYKINGLTSNSFQKFRVDVPNNDGTINMFLKFLPTQSAWYLDIEHTGLKVYNLKLVLSPNILREYRNIISFGLSVESNDGVYPMEITAFSSGRVTLNLLDSEYVQNLEGGVYVRN